MKTTVNDYSYDEELMENEFLKSHEYYLPYVGANYRDAKIKVLHIGNCHYIEPSLDLNDEFGCDFFVQNWFDNPEELNNKIPQEWVKYCMNTRTVIEEYLTAIRNPDNKVGTMNYKIFNFITKMLSDSIVAEKNIGCRKQIKSIRKPSNIKELAEYFEKTEIYKYVAFTDFHMFPSLIRGESQVLTALQIANQNSQIQNNVDEFYEEVKEKSWDTLKHIINVLKPDVILITSGPVSDIFPITEFDNQVIRMNHPNSLFSRNKREEYMNKFCEKVDKIINS